MICKPSQNLVGWFVSAFPTGWFQYIMQYIIFKWSNSLYTGISPQHPGLPWETHTCKSHCNHVYWKTKSNNETLLPECLQIINSEVQTCFILCHQGENQIHVQRTEVFYYYSIYHLCIHVWFYYRDIQGLCIHVWIYYRIHRQIIQYTPLCHT